jgi:molybdopterin-guanine dinucleotide biosynthesis protein A
MVGGYPQPLAAFYATSCLKVVRGILDGNGKHSMLAPLEKLPVRYVTENEMLTVDPQLRSFFDLDTPQDVTKAMRLENSK